MNDGRGSDDARVLTVEVDACEACPAGVSARFDAIGALRSVERLEVELAPGHRVVWRVASELDDDEAAYGTRISAMAVDVVLPSGTTLLLVMGGRRGLRVVHEETQTVELAPYRLVRARILA
jgi:hypothetical protein